MVRRWNILSVQIFCWLLLGHGALPADWNSDFDKRTYLLIQELPQLNHPDYLQKINSFSAARNNLLLNEELCDKLHSAQPLDKFLMVVKDLNLMFKKRKNDRIHDLYPWELSYLFGSTAYIVPSFAFEIGGKKVVIQNLESFKYGMTQARTYPKKGHSPKLVKSVSIKTYWKAHLQAYILGLTDLSAKNIGVNSEGVIRFFDNESSLRYQNEIINGKTNIKLGFLCQSFDWPQFREKIDKKTAKEINAYLQGFAGLEDRVKVYLQFRPIDFNEKGLAERLDKMRHFECKAGVSFRDFYGSLYPPLISGLQPLNEIVERICQRKVGDGSALLFMCRWIHSFSLSAEEREMVDEWIRTYIP